MAISSTHNYVFKLSNATKVLSFDGFNDFYAQLWGILLFGF